MNSERGYTKFIHYSPSSSTSVENKIEFTLDQHASLNDVLQQFEFFLKGMGYVFEGTLDIIKEDIQ